MSDSDRKDSPVTRKRGELAGEAIESALSHAHSKTDGALSLLDMLRAAIESGGVEENIDRFVETGEYDSTDEELTPEKQAQLARARAKMQKKPGFVDRVKKRVIAQVFKALGDIEGALSAYMILNGSIEDRSGYLAPHLEPAERFLRKQAPKHIKGLGFDDLLKWWKEELDKQKPPDGDKLPTKAWSASFIADPGTQTFLQMAARSGTPTDFLVDPINQIATFPGVARFIMQRQFEMPTGDYDNWEEEGEKHILAKIQGEGLSRDNGLLAIYALNRLFRSEGEVTIGVSELLDLRGQGYLNAKERQVFARSVHDALSAVSKWEIRGDREWTDPKTRKSERYNVSAPLFHYESALTAQKALPGMGQGDIAGFQIVDSTFSKGLRRAPEAHSLFGSLNKLTSLPTKKVATDWAASIGLTLAMQGRNNASHKGNTVKLSRKFLLTNFPPNTRIEDVLDGPNPARAKEYWRGAIQVLMEPDRGVIAKIEEPPDPGKAKKGWGKEWLAAVVTIELGAWGEHFNAIESAKRKRKGKKGGG